MQRRLEHYHGTNSIFALLQEWPNKKKKKMRDGLMKIHCIWMCFIALCVVSTTACVSKRECILFSRLPRNGPTLPSKVDWLNWMLLSPECKRSLTSSGSNSDENGCPSYHSNYITVINYQSCGEAKERNLIVSITLSNTAASWSCNGKWKARNKAFAMVRKDTCALTINYADILEMMILKKRKCRKEERKGKQKNQRYQKNKQQKRDIIKEKIAEET